MISASFTEIVALLGAVHGLFLGFVLLTTRRGDRTSRRLLGILILLFSVDLFEIVGYWTRWLEEAPHLWGISFFFPYLYGVLLCGYVFRLQDSKFSLRWKQLVHFLPFLGCLLVYLPFYASSAEGKLRMLRVSYPEMTSGVQLNYWMLAFWFLQFVHFSIYLGWAWNSLRRDSQSRHSAWLQSLLAAFSFSFAGWFAYGMSVAFGFSYAREVDFAAVMAMALTVYAIGYLGLTSPELFFSAGSREKLEKYTGSTLTERDLARLQPRLLKLMDEDSPFLDADLRLEDLAEQLGVSPNHMSQLVNQKFGQHFNEFVNSYRVKEVKRLLADPHREDDTVLSLAFEAGFNNKTSFNQAFKKQVGVTPSQFRRQIRTRELPAPVKSQLS